VTSAVLLPALLAGLCAAISAAPLTQEIRSSSEFLPNSSLEAGMPPAELTNSLAGERELFTPIAIISEGGPVPGSSRVPEPQSLVAAAVGCMTIALLGIYRLNWKTQRRRRRHSGQLRALTALR